MMQVRDLSKRFGTLLAVDRVIFMAQFRGIPLTGWELAEVWALLAAAVLLNVLFAIVPMRLGLKSLSGREV